MWYDKKTSVRAKKIHTIALMSEPLDGKVTRGYRMYLLLFIVNATLLILHEIESGYEKEWLILRLPFKLTGFLIAHIPVIIVMFYGAIEIYKDSKIGYILGAILGLAGTLPFFIHKIFIYRKDCFNQVISRLIILLNFIVGIIIIGFSIYFIK